MRVPRPLLLLSLLVGCAGEPTAPSTPGLAKSAITNATSFTWTTDAQHLVTFTPGYSGKIWNRYWFFGDGTAPLGEFAADIGKHTTVSHQYASAVPVTVTLQVQYSTPAGSQIESVSHDVQP